jgi:hypothetical protein
LLQLESRERIFRFAIKVTNENWLAGLAEIEQERRER